MREPVRRSRAVDDRAVSSRNLQDVDRQRRPVTFLVSPGEGLQVTGYGMAFCPCRSRRTRSSGFDEGAIGGYAIYCGADVGKSDHHACAPDRDGKRRDGKRLCDRPLSNELGPTSFLQVRGR